MTNPTIGKLREIISQSCTDAIAAIVPPGNYPLDTAIIDTAEQAIIAWTLEIVGEVPDKCGYYDCKVGEKCGKLVSRAEIRAKLNGGTE